MTNQWVRFVPVNPKRFSRDEWKEWFDGLTDDQQQQLRDKAKWEHMTLSAVAMEWGVQK